MPDIYDDDNSKLWAETMRTYSVVLSEDKMTHMYGSEHYVVDCAKHLGVIPVIVDLERVTYPISATEVRENPIAHRAMLPPTTRSYFANIVAVCGPESSGTTTLAVALAKHYQTACLAEFGRRYVEEIIPENHIWEPRDFWHIAATQRANIQEAASVWDLVITDTDAIATIGFEEMYLGSYSDPTVEIANQGSYRDYDRPPIYIVTAPTIPFVNDGSRNDDPQAQAKLFDTILQHTNHLPRRIVSDVNLEVRVAQAVEYIDSFLSL
jgi:NadR type nicotinamide-nucleotide adenylyltransferase